MRTWSAWTLPVSPRARIMVNDRPVGDDYGLVAAGEPLAIEAADGSTVQIEDMRGAAAELPLPVGHYFLSTAVDRANLGVIERGAPLAGLGHDASIYCPHNKAVAGCEWARLSLPWAACEPTRGAYTMPAEFAANFASVGGKFISLCLFAPGAAQPSWAFDKVNRRWLISKAEFLLARREFVRWIWRACGPFGIVEVENEPREYDDRFPFDTSAPGGGWDTAGLKARFDELCWFLGQDATAIREECPGVKVAGWIAQGPTTTLSAMQQNPEVAGLFNVLHYHNYELQRELPEAQVRHVRAWREAFGLKALFLGEVGIGGDQTLGVVTDRGPWCRPVDRAIDWYEGMCRALRYGLLMWHEGDVVIVPHRMFNGSNTEISCSGPRGPQPKLTALLTLARRLEGYVPAEREDVGSYHRRVWRSGPRTMTWEWLDDDTETVAAVGAMTVFGEPATRLGREPVMTLRGGGPERPKQCRVDEVLARLDHLEQTLAPAPCVLPPPPSAAEVDAIRYVDARAVPGIIEWGRNRKPRLWQ